GGLGLLVLFFALGFTWVVRRAAKWPATRGRVVAADVEAYRVWRESVRSYWQPLTLYKPSVVYTYEVNGRQYAGDRPTIGSTLSSTLPGLAKRTATKYPVGTEVDVYYNPASPG